MLAWLERCGHDAAGVWDEIGRLVTKTVLAAVPLIQAANAQLALSPAEDPAARCFELLGLDVLLDEDLRSASGSRDARHSLDALCSSALPLTRRAARPDRTCSK